MAGLLSLFGESVEALITAARDPDVMLSDVSPVGKSAANPALVVATSELQGPWYHLGAWLDVFEGDLELHRASGGIGSHLL
jgi:hypothetical protein